MDKNLEDECPICLDINGYNECILLECCNKYIHKDCINIWLMQNIKNNNIINCKCFYCYKNNNYFDDFINNNKNHHIVNINEQLDNQILESNNNTLIILSQSHTNTCIIVILIILSITLMAVWSVINTTLN